MKFAPHLAIVVLFFSGCTASRPIFQSATVVKDDSLPVTPRALEQLPTGRYYRFQMLTDDPTNQTSYVGRIVRADGDSVELTDVDREGRTTSKGAHFAGRISPQLGRLFKNTGVGVEILDGNKTLGRSEIAAMELLTPAEVNHRLAVKQRPPQTDESPQLPATEAEHVATQQDQGWHAAG